MTEIRCTYPFPIAGESNADDNKILLKRGTTVLYFDENNVGISPTLSIQSALSSRNAALSESEKKKFFQAFYEDELPSIPDSFEKKIAAIAAVPDLYFIFTDDISQKIVRAAANDEEAEKHLLPGTVGAESELLSQRLDWRTLLDESVDASDQRSHLLQLKECLELSREKLAAPAQGKLYRTRSDLISVLKDPILSLDFSSADLTDEKEARQLERSILILREKDEELREEQRTLLLLSIKNDYETLLKLRRKLEELESSSSHYANSITGQGRDITVHELTVLSGQYQDYQENENILESQREEIKEAQAERHDWEQKRILSNYRVKQLQEKIAEFDSEQDLEYAERLELKTDRHTEKSGIGLKHFLLLVGLLLTLLGLLLFKQSRAISIVSFVLAGISLAVSILLFIRSRLARQTTLQERVADSLRSPVGSAERNSFLKQLSEQKTIWHAASVEAERWAADVNSRQIVLNSLEEKQRRAGNELLRQLSRYAEIDSLSDAEYVLDALRNQRQSATSYDEAVSELLREIAEVRKGRTDEDMLREYERACEELYGDVLGAVDAGGQNVNVRSQALNFDEGRAKRIEIERVELSQDISRQKLRLQEINKSLQQKKEIFSRLPELRRKRDALEQNLWQEIHDIEQLDLAITLLDYLYIQWRALPLENLRSLTLKYSRRMQGLQPLDLELDDYMIEEQRGIRRTELNMFKSAKDRGRELDVIEKTPPDIIYLAFRMALLDSGDTLQPTPLFIFDMPLLSASSRISELLNLLDERMLELSAQSVFLTSNDLLSEIARERQIPVHQL
ncbi:MAG: hypothetical protein PHR78_07395 [Eubacteriales bacterium]|nr:hypothetical protein [Eubacteriales bacterium]MDD4541965.1 hypothetical protein [Eubacteriales bacterium]